MQGGGSAVTASRKQNDVLAPDSEFKLVSKGKLATGIHPCHKCYSMVLRIIQSGWVAELAQQLGLFLLANQKNVSA